MDHETKVEARAVSEGMIPEALPVDRPIAVEADSEEPAPRRRRVRRKPATAVELDITPAEAAEERDEPVLAEPEVEDAVAAESDPVEATEPTPAPVPAEPEVEAIPAPVETIELVAHEPAARQEVDVSSLIAEDPHQITEPPKKAKRGWWRR